MTTGNAVSHAAGAAGGTPVPVPFAPVGFDRTMAEVRLTVATHGTGAGLGGGAADPNWKIVSMPGLADGQSRPALVLTNPRPDYAGVGPDACWVAPTARLLNASPGKYVYRTTLDLTGYNAGSASVKAVMTADDGILDVRVNGTSVALPPATVNQATWRSVAETALVGAPWRAGPNQLDVVVYNGDHGDPDEPHRPAVRVDRDRRTPRSTLTADGTPSPRVTRSSGQSDRVNSDVTVARTRPLAGRRCRPFRHEPHSTPTSPSSDALPARCGQTFRDSR